MSYSIIIATTIGLAASTVAQAPFSSIKSAFEKNDAAAIGKLCNSKVLIDILGKEQAYSQSQATIVLKDFFKSHPTESFKVIFEGKETSEGSFAIATLMSKSTKYRVSIHMKQMSGGYKIASLSIEKD